MSTFATLNVSDIDPEFAGRILLGCVVPRPCEFSAAGSGDFAGRRGRSHRRLTSSTLEKEET
jgi:hypothetical protein